MLAAARLSTKFCCCSWMAGDGGRKKEEIRSESSGRWAHGSCPRLQAGQATKGRGSSWPPLGRPLETPWAAQRSRRWAGETGPALSIWFGGRRQRRRGAEAGCSVFASNSKLCTKSARLIRHRTSERAVYNPKLLHVRHLLVRRSPQEEDGASIRGQEDRSPRAAAANGEGHGRRLATLFLHKHRRQPQQHKEPLHHRRQGERRGGADQEDERGDVHLPRRDPTERDDPWHQPCWNERTGSCWSTSLSKSSPNPMTHSGVHIDEGKGSMMVYTGVFCIIHMVLVTLPGLFKEAYAQGIRNKIEASSLDDCEVITQ